MKMDTVKTLATIQGGNPDDLLLVVASHEERCLESAKRLAGDYRARAIAILYLNARIQVEGEVRRRMFTEGLFERLKERQVSGIPHILPIIPNDYRGLWLSLASLLPRPGYGVEEVRVSLDVSCLPKLEMAFIIRQVLLSGCCRCRIIYTRPERYVTEESGGEELVAARYRVLCLPYEAAASAAEKGSVRRVCLAILGQEGRRVLNIWRSIDPDKTYLLRGSVASEKQNDVVTRHNEYFLERIAIGDDGFDLFNGRMVDLEGLARRLRSIAVREKSEGPISLSIIPSGPKPISIAVMKWVIDEWSERCDLCYSTPERYVARYSDGVEEMYEFELGREDSGTQTM